MAEGDQEVFESYRLLEEEAAIVELPEMAVVELRGEDRKGWLQGQATNDLRDLHAGGSAKFCLCSPTGQLLAICGLWALPDRFIVSTDRAALPAFLERIQRMVILEDVVATDLTGSHEMLAIQGPSASERLRLFVELPMLDCAESPLGACVLRDDRTGRGGWSLLIRRSDKLMRSTLKKLVATASPSAVEIARLEAGIPAFGRDTGPKTLPPELGPAFVDAHISYQKGCYTGQEVLMRMHSRGHTNRTWVGLVGEGPIEAGTDVESAGQKVGTVTSSALSPKLGHIGAAMIRNEFASPGTQVAVSGVIGEVSKMPLV